MPIKKRKYGNGTQAVSGTPKKKKPTVEYMNKYVGTDRGKVEDYNKIDSNGGKPSAQMERKRKKEAEKTSTVAKTSYKKGTKGIKIKKKAK